MSEHHDLGRHCIYRIRVKGVLDANWSDWFDGFAITPLDCGDTVLAGHVVDQSALHGVLNKIRDIGLPLLSLNRVDADSSSNLDVWIDGREDQEHVRTLKLDSIQRGDDQQA
jgi:hypothetical protein